MGLRSTIGTVAGYGAYAICALALAVAGWTLAAFAVFGGGSDPTTIHPVGSALAAAGVAMLSFVAAKVIFQLTNHPEWALDLSNARESIRFR